MPERAWSFLIVAGGSGSRLGGEPKQFRRLGDTPVWKWSARVAESLWNDGRVSELVVVVPPEYLKAVEDDCGTLKMPSRAVCGGAVRSGSVMNGLRLCSGSHVLVHDGARPFITAGLCLKLMEEAEKHGSAVPLLASSDSLKRVRDGRALCVDRKDFYRTQTPQCFEREPLINAIEAYGLGGSDEAAAWCAAGRELGFVEGEEANFKITTPFDWTVAKALAGSTTERRTGHGYDVHRLVAGRRLVLAGVEINDAEFGLLGHSDADIVTHTVMDAILGAAGEPDIGTLFPAQEAKWRDAVSTELLKTVIERIRAKGWRIDWVDVTLTAQAPKLGHLISAFTANLSQYLSEGGGKTNFNMKVKSGEECGSVGRGECMVCHGVATLSRIQ